MTDVSGNVEAISEYTIGTSGTITYTEWVIFGDLASAQVTLDNPGFTTAQSNYAQALYVCHLIASKLGKSGKTAESLGRGSYSKTLASGQTNWLDQYKAFIDAVAATVTSTTAGIQSLSTDGITRDDKTMDGLGLDQSTPYDLADEDRSD
jgi:hypothetical protein